MKRMTWILAFAVLVMGAQAAVAGSAQSESWRHCSPEGVWYGYNSEGADLISTVDKTGSGRYTMVFDAADPPRPPALGVTNFRGELWRTGPGDWSWKTFGYYALDPDDPASFGFPYLMIVCPGTVEWDSCDAWHSDDAVCEWYAFFHGQDPFEEGVPFGETPLSVSYKRMPRGE